MNKEQGLLGIVVAVTAALWFMGSSFTPVPEPRPDAPPPPAGLPPERSGVSVPRPAPGTRSMFVEFSDLISPPLVVLPAPPAPAVPLAVPPTRPFPLPGPSAGLRQLLTEPEAAPEPETAEPPPEDEGAAASEAPPEEGPKPPDLATYDWVVMKEMANRAYGIVEMLPADIAAGRRKFELAADPTMDFTWKQIDPKSGRVVFTAPRFRERVAQVGFADTIENNYGVKRAQLEVGGRKPDEAALKELARWTLEEAEKPRYHPRRFKAYELATETFREALRLKPDAANVRELGAALRRALDLEQEISLYNWWLERQGGAPDPAILSVRGRALEALGLPDRARADYERALLASPDGETRLRLAEIQLAMRTDAGTRAAEESFRRAGTEGMRGRAGIGEARAALALGRTADAEALLGRVASSDRDSEWFAAQGSVLYCKGDVSGARDHFVAAVEKAPAGSEARAVARTNLAIALARLASSEKDVKERKAKADEAVKAADEALVDDPLNWYWPHVARGWALRASGQRDAAVEALQEAVAASPSEPYGLYLLGEFLLRDGRGDEARLRLLDAVRLAPSLPDALGGVGRCKGGPAGQGRDYLRRAVELEPKSALWRVLLVNALLFDDALGEAARLEEARRELLQLTEKVDRTNPLAFAYLGWVVYRQGNADGALDQWNHALNLLPQGSAAAAMEASGTPASAVRGWLTDAIAAVSKWKATKIWRDDFQRPDGPTVGNGWKEVEKVGVKVNVRENGVQLGRDKQVGTERASVYQEWDLQKVLRASAEISRPSNEQAKFAAEFGVWGGTRVLAVIGLEHGPNGVRLLFKPDQRKSVAEEINLDGFAWPEDGKVAVEWTLSDPERGAVLFSVNGRGVVVEPGENSTLKARVLQAGEPGRPIEMPGFIRNRGSKFRMECSGTAAAGIDVFGRLEAAEAWLNTQQ